MQTPKEQAAVNALDGGEWNELGVARKLALMPFGGSLTKHCFVGDLMLHTAQQVLAQFVSRRQSTNLRDDLGGTFLRHLLVVPFVAHG